MPREGFKKLGELLVDFNYITEEELREAIDRQQETNKRLGELLVELGYVEESDLVQVLEFQLGIPHVELSNYLLGAHLARYIPEHLARRYTVIALEKEGDKLIVAMDDPSNLLAIEDIEMRTDLKVEPRIAATSEIKRAINTVYSMGEDDTTEIIASLDEDQEAEEPELDRLKEMVEDAPIVKLANVIINQAVRMRASDIHIEPQAENVRVRYRIDGVLKENMTAPKYSQAALTSRLKIIADLDITKRMIPQDGRVAMNVGGIKVDMRVSTLPTIYGEKVVIRLLRQDTELINIDKLGFTAENREKFIDLIEQPHGILLVTGPTGSGKSTTLFSALRHLNSTTKNIVTIEDPVEYRLDGINQIQANNKTGLTFARTMRAILRQDPDIVMVGEIRDEETARIAIRAALTGHLVLSTLHTNDAVSSITRLVDMGIEPYLVASTVKGVLAQRLVRRLCDSCKEKYDPPPEEQALLQPEEGTNLYRSGGCNKCNSTGYYGRLAVQELLIVDDKIKELVVEDADEQKLKEYAINKGMKALQEDGIAKVKKGLTTYEELIRVIV
ncbi:MAG: type II secretion system ATPase GspE [Bacillota bacterium]